MKLVLVVHYHDWGLLLPEGRLRVGGSCDPFQELVRDLRGPQAAWEWQSFMACWLEPFCRAVSRIPLLGLRDDHLMAAVLGWQGAATWLRNAPRLARLGGSFGPMVRRHRQDPFLLRWVGVLCFLIFGLLFRSDQCSGDGHALR